MEKLLISKNNVYWKNVTFTLLELMMVVAIIVILSAILLPALKTVRDTARSTICANKLKQLGTANLMYADDMNGYCIGVYSGIWYWFANTGSPAGQYLATNYLPGTTGMAQGDSNRMYSDKTMLFCKQAIDEELLVAWMKNSLSYAYNYSFAGFPLVSKVKNPSRKFMFLDANTYHVDSATTPSWISTRHNKKANVFFIDGHLGKTSPQTLSSGNI